MNHEYWYLSRAAGFTAYLLLFTSVALGIAIGTRFADRIAKRNVLFDLHRFTTILALAFTIFHVYILLGDQYFSFNVWELSIPFLTPYRTIETAAGIFALYAMILTVSSFYVRQFIGYRAWRAIHFLTFALFAGALYHGITAGTDTSEVWAKLIYLATAFVTVTLVLYRVQYRIPDTPAMRAVRLGAALASIVSGVLLISATGLLTATRPATAVDVAQAEPAATAPATGDGANGVPASSPGPYPFLASFNDDLSGTYTQSRNATASRFVLDGVATGDLNLSLHLELDQSNVVTTPSAGNGGVPVVTTNVAELRDPATGAVLCSGTLTAFQNGRMQLTCDGVGPYAGVSFTVAGQINADRSGGFNGALSGSMKRNV